MKAKYGFIIDLNKPIYAGGHLGDESDDLPKGYQK